MTYKCGHVGCGAAPPLLGESIFSHAEIEAKLTQSHAAGRAEGLEEAAKLVDALAAKAAENEQQYLEMGGEEESAAGCRRQASTYRMIARLVRALAASDPRDRLECPIGGQPDTCSAGTCDACAAAYRAAHPVEPGEVERVARAIEPETFDLPKINLNRAVYDRAFKRAVRAIAAMTPPHAPDGLLRLALDNLDGIARGDDIPSIVIRDQIRAALPGEHSPAPAPGLAQEVERAQEVETAYREGFVDATGADPASLTDGTRSGLEICWRCSDARAALSAPRPAQPKGPTE
jgi:hypothetical protein